MNPWEGSENELRERAWYAQDPTVRDPLSVTLKRLADRVLGGSVCAKALVAKPSGYVSGETAALCTFMAECASLRINPNFAIAYLKRATTACTLVDVEFYGRGTGHGFSVSGESMAYAYQHCLVDAGLGILLASGEVRPHAEYTLGFVLGEHSALAGRCRPDWFEHAAKLLHSAGQHGDSDLARRSAKAAERVKRLEQSANKTAGGDA